jgi:DDE superfamily endonuclease
MADAEFVARMEDLLELYQSPDDPLCPVVCMDELCKQLIAETRAPLPVHAGAPACYDYEYERKGVCNLFVFLEPRRGWRKVFVRDRRTKVDWAHCVRVILNEVYPQVMCIRLVQDNLNTHGIASLYEAFPPEEARKLARRLEMHHTPKHGSWLNMAETELSILNRQCLDRRLEDLAVVQAEVEAWETKRNEAKATINWRFTVADARVKLKNVYPSIEF